MEGGAGGGIGEDLGAGVDAQGDGGLVVAKDDVSAQEPSRVSGQADISVVNHPRLKHLGFLSASQTAAPTPWGLDVLRSLHRHQIGGFQP